jgi:hypothetical protein
MIKRPSLELPGNRKPWSPQYPGLSGEKALTLTFTGIRIILYSMTKLIILSLNMKEYPHGIAG